MLTITDFILILHKYYKSPLVSVSIIIGWASVECFRELGGGGFWGCICWVLARVITLCVKEKFEDNKVVIGKPIFFLRKRQKDRQWSTKHCTEKLTWTSKKKIRNELRC